MSSCNSVYQAEKYGFSEAKSCKELKDFLIGVSKKHKVLHHFTTIDTLIYLLNDKTWKFSSPKETNDLQELEKLDPQNIDHSWDNLFSSSFTHGDDENMGMWVMYDQRIKDLYDNTCIEGRAQRLFPICISFFNTFWVTLTDSKNNANSDNIRLCDMEKNRIFQNEQFDISMNDIVYYHGLMHSSEARLCWGNIIKKMDEGDLVNIKKGSANCLVGFLKNSAWEYEKETRITIRFNKPIDRKDFLLHLDGFDPRKDILKVQFSPFTNKTRDEIIDYVKEKTNSCYHAWLDLNLNSSYFYKRLSTSNVEYLRKNADNKTT